MARILKHGITEEASAASNNAQELRQTVENILSDIRKEGTLTVQYVS
ncbi:hypothetical protein OK016_21345 [Vibrio chagasii]|nr:hypothetical protein [Vibrio chagasii]